MENRIDKELVNRNLVPSRSKAQELIKAELVECNHKIIDKCNFLVKDNDILTIKENDRLKYVSRGGLKLEKAIDSFHIDFTNLKVMDIGSSTGGFCDCALQHNASSIIAIDVGTDLMDKELRKNPKIELHEQTNFKQLEHFYFENIDIITCDVSFISLTKVIEKIQQENIKIDIVGLIKPQFECGREIATKYKGVILDKKVHIEIIKNFIEKINTCGFYLQNIDISPIKGGDGNIEYISFLSNKIKDNRKIDITKLVEEAFKNVNKLSNNTSDFDKMRTRKVFFRK